MGLTKWVFHYFKLSYPITETKLAFNFEELLQNLKTLVLIFKLIIQRFVIATNP